MNSVGYVSHTIHIKQINSKSLRDPRIYYLFDPYTHTKHQYAFDFVGYFGELAAREHIPGANGFVYDASIPYVFCVFSEGLIKYLYDKYQAHTIYYETNKRNYYQSCVFGFLFEDDRKRLLYEVQYNSLREKYLLQ